MIEPFGTITTLDGERLTFAQVEARAHRKRSDALMRFFGAMVRGAGRFVVALFDSLATVRTIQRLALMDDAALARMGIRREDLPTFIFDTIHGDAAKAPATDLAAISGGLPGRPAPAANVIDRHAA